MNIEEGKWVLDPDVLFSFVRNMETNDKLLPVTRQDGVKEYMLPLRSAYSESVFYELLVKRGQYNGVISISVRTPEAETSVKVYENGVILRWGVWALELMKTLPELIARESKEASIESDDPEAEEATFNMIERKLRTAADIEWSDPDLRDRSGMPISLLQ